MNGRYFTYDGEDSKTHQLAIAGLEQADDVVFGLSREVLRSSLNRYRNRVGHMGTRWNDVLTFNIQFIKSPCDNESNSKMFFSEDEVNEINTWLTSPDYPTLFHMYDYDFERDSSDSMILIDLSSDTSLTVQANGYYPVTYTISGSTVTAVVDNTPQYDEDEHLINLTTPPTTATVTKYDGYYSLVILDNDFLGAISTITVNGTEYTNTRTNSWLSTYDWVNSFETNAPENPLRNNYTILINTEKLLNNKYDYFGVFSDVSPQVIDGNVVGFQATFETDSPFAWTHEIVQTITNGSVTFTVNSAEKYREIYPLIRVTSTDQSNNLRSDFKITTSHPIDNNQTESYEMELSLRTGDTTTIDSRLSIIKDLSGLVSFTDLGIDDVDYIYWPKLFNGQNTVTLTGTGTATITYREPRKVGDY